MSSVDVVIGRVGKAHGLRGEVTIDLRTDEPETRFAAGAVLRREDGRGSLTVVRTRVHQSTWLVTFAEASDRTAAETLRGAVLVASVDETARPEGDDEDYYDRQLVGLNAITADGTRVGEVTEVIHLPMQDLLAIDTPEGERLVPFVRALVPTVDLAAGICVLAGVPGLLEDLDDEAEPATESDEPEPT